jgi:alkylation response protein AidB-like acyl-CoA dehydrogenase
VLVTHDRYGNRVDRVRYHPAYHELMTTAVGNGLHAAPWADARAGAHVARAAKIIVWYQVDGGHICPISMTYSVVPALRHAPGLAADWEPLLTSRTYDPADGLAARKAGATCGMAMTEKQGGSDVRANTTTAQPVDADGFALTGHKWFCSAPMSDAFLMLAQAPKGLSCFLVPRWLPDGARNPIRIQRLKDKLGDRSNASSEIELVDTWGALVGEEGRGIPTIIEMVNHTRLDCVLGSTAIMRQGVAQATWHTHYRKAFGAQLDKQPLMTNVLADLALESEAATAAALRLARAFEADANNEHEQRIKRLVTPVVKYWTCKRAPQHAAEALECLGGAGYVEEVRPAAPVPAEPAQRRVGRVRERHLPRRAARDRTRPGRPRRVLGRGGDRARCRRAARWLRRGAPPGVRRPRAPRIACAGPCRAARVGIPGIAAGATCAPARRRRVLRVPARRRVRPGVRCVAYRHRHRRDRRAGPPRRGLNYILVVCKSRSFDMQTLQIYAGVRGRPGRSRRIRLPERRGAHARPHAPGRA